MPAFIITAGAMPSDQPSPNQPLAILSTWTALEALSPQTFRNPEDLASGKREHVVALSEGSLPWDNPAPPPKSYKLFHQVFLGAVAVDRAMDALVKAFGEDEERSRREREKAAMAVVLVDEQGILLEENSIAVSSFVWALPLALRLKLVDLGEWTTVERTLQEGLRQILQRCDKEGRSLPLDLETIREAHEWLVDRCELPAELLEPPTFVIRVYQLLKSKRPLELPLLNSFFLSDLRRAANHVVQGTASAGLKRYLAIERSDDIVDILADKSALENAVAPASTPPARWPSGHPLVMLQQAAVNSVRSELVAATGIAAVNGPPGTGKTTLLRDLIAQCILDRALAMAAFEDPDAAFKASGQRSRIGEKGSVELYELHPSLKGHEIVVASSNNKAVENISKEIPAAAQINRPTTELAYFKSISDFLFQAHDRDEEEETETEQQPIETWGLIAAVLGNARNRRLFQEAVWWDDECSLRVYLKAAKGDSVVKEERDPISGQLRRRQPKVVLAENPPMPSEVKGRWRKARDHLLALKREVDVELARLEDLRQQCVRLREAAQVLLGLRAQYDELKAQVTVAEKAAARRRSEVEDQSSLHAERVAALRAHRRDRPGWIARIFRTRRWRIWRERVQPIAKEARESADQLKSLKRALSQAQTAVETSANTARAFESSLHAPGKKVDELRKLIEPSRMLLQDRLADDRFFSQEHGTLHLSCAWLPDTLQRKRENLFVASMAVHKAFIDASAQKVLHNLSVLMNSTSSGSLSEETRRRLLGDLWSTQFLVVPVISTTFASVDRMLGELPPDSIGWLFIDEAGQALPQAAVGAIMRARRTVIVGDPLQIPPVVTLPEKLVAKICAFFNVFETEWAAPKASAQTLGDRASHFQSAFDTDTGPRRVGLPLLVHRRCQEPMFGISNAIAYNDLMVHAVGPRDLGPIGSLLGESRWLDIDGEADSKWCEDEGRVVMSLLHRIAASIERPDVFIITPFKIVAQSMSRLIETDEALLAALRVSRKWLGERIGTIHTFQGDEADTVILLLGAPKATQSGSREWAAAMPNILNVAVSRAKQNLYVVGSHGAWSTVGHCRVLARRLPSERVVFTGSPPAHLPTWAPSVPPAGESPAAASDVWLAVSSRAQPNGRS
jgi:hypothetical protein